MCREQLRGDDVVARYGGDEFVVLLPETGTAEGIAVLERVRLAMAKRALWAGSAPFTVSISVGVAGQASSTQRVDERARPASAALDELLRRADRALYRAKAKGRNRVVVATAGDSEVGDAGAQAPDGSLPVPSDAPAQVLIPAAPARPSAPPAPSPM